MSIRKTIDISAEFPNISGNNRKILQDYYNDCVVSIVSDSAYQVRFALFRKILSCMDVVENKPVAEWNDDDCIKIIQVCNLKKTTVDLLKTMLRKIIKYAGGEVPKIEYNMIMEYSSPIIRFSDLDKAIRDGFDDQNPDVEWDEINTWSTYIVVAYLLWLGFNKGEIVELKTADFNPVTGTIIYNSGKKKIICVINEPAITEYLDDYVNAKTYITHASGRRCDYNYPESESLIKVEKSSRKVIENYALKFPKYFGLYADEILLAGRMSKMYYLEKVKGIVIEQSNLDTIADYLNLSERRCVLESLIPSYQSYRDKRLAGK